VSLQDLAPEDLPILAPVALVMDAIAASKVEGTSGYVRFNANGFGSHATWRDFLTSITDPRRYDWEIAGQRADMTRIGPWLDEVLLVCTENLSPNVVTMDSAKDDA
jgi:hygromycin-B 4-O-kinase